MPGCCRAASSSATKIPAAGARREAVEETGHRVKVYEFLGAITYRARGRPKVVQFWRMKAAERPSRDVMKDIVAVEWLPLAAAVRRLSYPLEKLFLRHVGRRILKRRRKHARRKSAGRAAKRRSVKRRKAQRSTRDRAANARAPRKRAAIPPQALPKFNARGGAARRFPNAPFSVRSREKWNPALKTNVVVTSEYRRKSLRAVVQSNTDQAKAKRRSAP